MAVGTESSELERMKQERDHEHEMYLRALADFDNYRRRMERERTSSARQGKREILLPMIDLLDGFERAADHMAEAPPSIAEGFGAIHRQLLSLLDAQGVTPLATAGQNFDPGLHEAV